MRHRSWILLASLIVWSCSDSTGPGPEHGPALGTAGDFLLVAGSLSEDWRAVDIGGAVPVVQPGSGLTGVAPNDIDVAENVMYVTNSGDNSISVVDLATGVTVGAIEIGPGTNPWELFIDPGDPGRGWLTTLVSGEVVELDLARRAVVERVEVGAGLEGLYVTGTHVVATLTGFDLSTFEYGQGYVVVLDKESLDEVARLAVPTNPQFLLQGVDGRLHAVCTGDFGFPAPGIFGKVVRIESDLSAVRDTLDLGGSPARGAVAVNGTAYLAGFFGGVMAYDTATFTAVRDATNPVLGETGFTDVEIFGGALYAANFDGDKVVKLALAGSDTTEIPLAIDGPSAIAVRNGIGP